MTGAIRSGSSWRVDEVVEGSARGQRSALLRPVRGIDVRVLLDRGMDIGEAWFCGIPISWRTARGEGPFIEAPDLEGWQDSWVGGLVNTCGLANVGPPSGGEPRHGRVSQLSASDCRVGPAELNGSAGIQFRGTVLEASPRRGSLSLTRTIFTAANEGRLVISDVVTNLGDAAEYSPLLYHLNIGKPILADDTTVTLSNGEHAAMDAFPDVVIQGRDLRGASRPDALLSYLGASGLSATIHSPAAGVRLRWEWDTLAQPFVHVWQRFGLSDPVMSIEPANCLLDGREADVTRQPNRFLAPGESRVTTLSLCAEELDFRGGPIERYEDV